MIRKITNPKVKNILKSNFHHWAIIPERTLLRYQLTASMSFVIFQHFSLQHESGEKLESSSRTCFTFDENFVHTLYSEKTTRYKRNSLEWRTSAYCFHTLPPSAFNWIVLFQKTIGSYFIDVEKYVFYGSENSFS